jgi:hypothetical protein
MRTSEGPCVSAEARSTVKSVGVAAQFHADVEQTTPSRENTTERVSDRGLDPLCFANFSRCCHFVKVVQVSRGLKY